jgi:hypothetical protein
MSEFWGGRRVFVTGATGFLGSWMVRELRRHGAFVAGLVRDIPAEPLLFDDSFSRPDFAVHGRLEDYDSCCARSMNTKQKRYFTWPRSRSSASRSMSRAEPSRPISAAPGTCWRRAARSRP